MTDAERRMALEAIAQEVRTCTRCPLHAGRTKAVPGEGSPDTEVVFVGEGPGREEDAQGRPFVGESGKLLDRLIRSVGWQRDEVFITNVVKCRPPANRDPEATEIAACAPYLERQLEILDPALVVTLGRHSLGRFRPGERIGQAHGTVRPVDPATGARQAVAMAMYHPAYAVRDRTNEPILFSDMARAPDALIDSRRTRLGLDAQADGAATTASAAAAPTPVEAATPSAPATPAEISSVEPAPAELASLVAAGAAESTDPTDQLPLF